MRPWLGRGARGSEPRCGQRGCDHRPRRQRWRMLWGIACVCDRVLWAMLSGGAPARVHQHVRRGRDDARGVDAPHVLVVALVPVAVDAGAR
eukprot:6405210-Prymnesium_polylepis.1